jgi:hypothetical protein
MAHRGESNGSVDAPSCGGLLRRLRHRQRSRAGWCCVALAAALVAGSGRSGAAQTLLLDTFTSATGAVGAFSGTATRSNIGNNVSFNTVAGVAQLLADGIDTPTYSGLNYAFSPFPSLGSKVSLTARNRQGSASETGILSVQTITSTGTFTLSGTLPGNTPSLQVYDFDFTALAGSTMSLRNLQVLWDVPLGVTGLRGLSIGQIDLFQAGPGALIWNTTSGTWNTTATNWTQSGGGSYAFASGDTVTSGSRAGFSGARAR